MADRSLPVLIDTSVWVDALRGRTPSVAAAVSRLLTEDLALTCAPVLFEIRRGLRGPDRRRVIPLMAAVRRLPLDDADWEAAGDLDASLRKDGRTLPTMDVLIAYVCLRDNVPILALDDHYRVVPGLTVLSPPLLAQSAQ